MIRTEVSPEPTDDEVAAILAAVAVAASPAATAPDRGDVARWRWSGRWWTKPIPARRTRPW